MILSKRRARIVRRFFIQSTTHKTLEQLSLTVYKIAVFPAYGGEYRIIFLKNVF